MEKNYCMNTAIEFKIPHKKLGKLIVACNKDDANELDSIKKG